MDKFKVAEPDYDFTIKHTAGKDLLGKKFFTPDVSIIKCTQGEAIITINSRTHSFKAGTNFMLIETILFKVIECSSDFMITTCHFSLLFMNEIYPILDNKVIDVLQYSAPDICSDEMIISSDLIFRQLCILHQNTTHTYRHKVVMNNVVNYIYEIYELTHKHINSEVVCTSNYVNYILDSFWVLCYNHHKHHRNIKYYADKLNISSRYLHKITKDAIQLTPKQIIDYYVSGTVKKMLLTTILTNQQIADKMNFPDQATFGQFFKRNVGMSPSEFRNKYR